MDAPAQEIPRTIRIDAPRPAEVYPDVAVVLRECDEFIVVGIGDVHQDKLRVKIPCEQRAHISCGNTLHRHPVVASVVSGVNLEGEIVLGGEFYAACPTPIAKAEARRFVNLVWRLRQDGVQCFCCLVIAAFNPIERAVIGVLGFHGDCERGVFRENLRHTAFERTEVGDINAYFSVDSTWIDLSVAKRCPR